MVHVHSHNARRAWHFCPLWVQFISISEDPLDSRSTILRETFEELVGTRLRHF